MATRPLLNPSLASSFNTQSGAPLRESKMEASTSTTPKSVRDAEKMNILYRIAQLWERGWTAEAFSCIFALASLAGLIVTLLAHRNKPIPEWPHLVTINSIVSLFSLLIRGGVGFVLAEGISQLKWQWFGKIHKLNDMDRFDSASRGAWGSIILLCKPRMSGS